MTVLIKRTKDLFYLNASFLLKLHQLTVLAFSYVVLFCGSGSGVGVGNA